MKNLFKTGIYMLFLTLILLWIGAALGGRVGVVIAFIFAFGMNFFSYWYSDRIVLAIYRAIPVSYHEYPELHRAVNGLASKMRVPVPRIYMIDHPTPNAFATGRDPEHAAVAVTSGILETLTQEELEGVLAHEMAHVKNRDTLIQTVVATIAGAITMLAYIARFTAIFGGMGDRDRDGGLIGLLVMSIVAPIAALLIQLAISRTREYQADESGARISGKPYALANALEKLRAVSRRIPMEVSPNTAHLFIVNPLQNVGFATLFSTHPPLEDRIARLKSMKI
ncbi:MAG TPA: protease HtpX [Candidatus Omnitrophica bacterium]|nr:protease HtpX [Candidatus Omnitrophota bacterium]